MPSRRSWWLPRHWRARRRCRQLADAKLAPATARPAVAGRALGRRRPRRPAAVPLAAGGARGGGMPRQGPGSRGALVAAPER